MTEPVVVGVGQVTRSGADQDVEIEPFGLMAEAVAIALRDCGAPQLAGCVDAISVLRGFWPYRAPAARLAAAVGAPARLRRLAPPSGVHAQVLVHDSAVAIARGELRAALIVGADASHSRRLATARGATPTYSTDGEYPLDEQFGEAERVWGAAEENAGIIMPATVYAMIDSALRRAQGLTVDEHRRHLADLGADLSRVATSNPYAWSTREWSADALLAPGPSNRMLAFPYTTRLVSRWSVDQAAAVLLCSVDVAREAGVDPAACVHLRSGVDSAARLPVSQRPDIGCRPPVRYAALRVLQLAQITAGDLDHVDLYSCFPAAVQVQAEALGLPLAPAPTVTGGMAFAGGPVNSYTLHALAAMVDRLRTTAPATGLVSSVGGVLDKQSFTVLSSAASPQAFRYEDAGDACTEPGLPVTLEPRGRAEVVGATVRHDGDAPEAVTLVELDGGTRAIVTSCAPDLVAEVEAVEVVGRAVDVHGPGELSIR